MDHSRRLYLLRHAKSDWGDPSLPDHLRPLAPRGQRAARALRRHLADEHVEVGLVLCSPAVRTRETLAAVLDGLAGTPELRYEPAIYAATSDTLLHLLHAVDPAVGALLLVGHNPGVGDLAIGLRGNGASAADDGLRGGYPTGGLASFDLPQAWPDLVWGQARLVSFVRPCELPHG